MENSINVKGDLEIFLHGPSGELKSHVSAKNLVVTVGKNWIASRMVGASSTVMSHMAIGTGSTGATTPNTTLVTETGRVVLTSTVNALNQVTYSAFFPAGTGTGSIVEAGIFNASSAGTMLARTTFGVISKDTIETLTINWTITIL